MVPMPYNLTVDLKGINSKKDNIKCTVGDSNAYQLNVSVINDKDPVNLTNHTAKIFFTKEDNTKVFQDLIIDDAINGKMHVIFDSQVTSFAGRVDAAIKIYDASNGKLTIGSFAFMVGTGAMDDEAIISTNQFTALDLALAEVTDFTNTKTELRNARQGKATLLENLQDKDSQLAEKVNKTDLDAISENIGDKSQLNTNDKSNIVKAVNEVKTQANTTATDLQNTNNAVSNLQTKVTNTVSGSPKGTYATLDALNAAFPTGNTNIYVVVADGNWYYWNGSWMPGGLYQNLIIQAYPFQYQATNTTFISAIKDIRLFNADITHQYCVNLVYKLYNGKSQILISDTTTGQVVCQFIRESSVNPTGIEKINLAPYGSQIETADMVINWDSLEDNFTAQSQTYAQTGILSSCIYDRSTLIKRNEVDPNVISTYPFQINASEPYMIGAIKDIKLYNADITHDYSVGLLTRRNNDTSSMIQIYDNTNANATVAQWYSGADTSLQTGVKKLTLTNYGGSTVYGYIVLDWDSIPSGYASNGLGYDKSGILKQCIYIKDTVPIGTEDVTIGVKSMYPFAVGAENEWLVPIVTYINMVGFDANKQYYVKRLYKNYSNQRNIQIATSDGTVVADFWRNIDTDESTTDKSYYCDEIFDDGDKVIKFGIYWNGGFGNDSYTFAQTKLSPTCIIDTLLLDVNKFYPFKNSFGNKNLRNIIKDIKLYGADITHDYKITQFYVANVLIITIYDATTSTEVCTCQQPYSQGPQYYIVGQYNNSGITAKALLEINGENFQYNGINVYLSPKCIMPCDYSIVLPTKVPCVVGHEMNLYYENVLLNTYLKNVVVTTSYTDGHNYKNYSRMTWKPVSGDANTIPYFYSTEHNTIKAIKTTTLVPIDTNVGNGLTKKIIIIGDSKTDQRYKAEELVNLFSTDVMNIQLLGTRGTAPYNTEGRSSWGLIDYTTNSTRGGFTNPFWNPDTNTFDFSYYMSQQGYSSVDIVFIDSGANDGGRDWLTYLKPKYEIMINSIHAYDPSIKVCLNLQEGTCLAEHIDNVMDYGKVILKIVDNLIKDYDNRQGENIFVVPNYLNVDLYNDFPMSEFPLSARNSTTTLLATDVVHPSSTAGMLKIADVYYYFIKYLASLG